jgi:hypothetical protein
MLHVLIFLHVFSAVSLGSFVILPFLIRRLLFISDTERIGFITALISFTRVGHYALIILLLTGVGLIVSSTNKPSIFWVVTALVLLLIISATIGMLSGKLKKLIGSELRGDSIAKQVRRITIYSWLTAVSIIVAIIVMTGR